jgi:hypothetical protein
LQEAARDSFQTTRQLLAAVQRTDLSCLPLSVCVCVCAACACLLLTSIGPFGPLSPSFVLQAAVEPLVWGVYGALGRSVHFFKVDASELAGEQEELSYCQLQQRTLVSRQVGSAYPSPRLARTA